MEPILLYYNLKIAFSGLILFALINYLYIYLKVPRKDTRASLIITSLASLYLLSDVFTDFFTITMPHEDTARFLVLLKELIPLLFLFMAPYYLGRLYVLKGPLKKINLGFFLGGLMASGLIAAAIIYELIFIHDAINMAVNGGTARVLSPGLLYSIRNILFAVYLIYTIILMLISEMENKSSFPIKNIFTGLVISSYIVFYYIYIIVFTSQGDGSPYAGFPHFSLGIVIFIVFMSFSITDISVISGMKLIDIQNTINKSLYQDPALGLPNRHCFKNDLLNELNTSFHNDINMSLFFLDIDDFQNINESYGESVGNELLRLLSRRLAENFAHAGTLYRIGGDEFAFLMKGAATNEEAGDFAAKIISSLRNPFFLEKESYLMTVSIAILLVPRDGGNPDIIMNNAYSTIHSAKKKKNTYIFFDKALLEGSARNINTVNLLRNCIVNEEFVLHYQPIVDTEGKIVCAEALLRCTNNNPEIGGPGNFIPLIEKAGLMKDLDNLVVRKAFYDMEMKIKNRLGISINMSAAQLTDPAYGDFLASFAKQHSIESGRLILEITETTLMDNILMARESLARLKNKGFIIAIDDFGKGFSSLSYLAELPVDILKIDMDFVRPVPGDKKKEMLAKYIIDLGKSLNLTVLAEGFEQPEQVDFFRKHGCALYQGYYFSRPLPLQDLLEKYSL
ncbi:MAG: hypothetical protein CVV44_09640 [Spirochaetae bacterium HGW-Spirochaetae-1]|jgi:diguanylate cyclase (GGDEF)-like protein|nr:MAG: hypothetical protein CVV44_09640 [Spirochaetae bacterium HGW-Spirochaetae-1]